MKKQLCNEELTRILERENVITFKRKNDAKASIKSQKDEEKEQVMSNINDDSNYSKNTKRDLPLPQITREKRRMQFKPSDIKPATVYFEKEVRQRDNLMLKNSNNYLTSENTKLKTKNANLEKEILRLQKAMEDDSQKGWVREGKHNDSLSLKIVMRNLKKELEDLKKQNTKLKTSVKFTTISELEVERDSILEETQRLKELLEEQRSRTNYLRQNQQSNSQQELKQMQDRNFALARENSQLKKWQAKNGEERSGQKQDFQKNMGRQLLNARNILKEKEKQIEYLKTCLRKASSTSLSQDSSLRVIDTHPLLHPEKGREAKSELASRGEPRGQGRVVKEKRLMSKSAQKYRAQAHQVEKSEGCESCRRLREANGQLEKQVESLRREVERARSVRHSAIDDFNKNPIPLPSQEEVSNLRRFLLHRFKAHHLTAEEASLHLINLEGDGQGVGEGAEMSIGELIQTAMAEPFSVLNDRYMEVFILELFYAPYPSSEPILIAEGRRARRGALKEGALRLMGPYALMEQGREDEMFIQIAELVTHYQQHIHKALAERRNTETTLPEEEFYAFFREIELEPEYIDFMVTQIILESIDLDHLNIYNLFEIFYMPQQEQLPAPTGKAKFKMIDTVVKEEDEEYEESKSFLDSKRRSREEERKEAIKITEKSEEEVYQQHFEEERGGSKGPVESSHIEREEHQVESEEEYIEDYES